MSDKSQIEWTDATWTPVVGCTRVSAGCDHCYAFALHDRRYIAWKRGAYPDAPTQYHQPFSKVQLLPERLTQPLRWRNPRRVFVNSLSDLFHDDVPDEYIASVFMVMMSAPRHTFQVLTKRPERMWRLVPQIARSLTKRDGTGWPLPNVWLGVSVEDQATADARIPFLLETPAAARFISAEPLLGPITLGSIGLMNCPPAVWIPWYEEACPPGLHWVIVGGESGPHARPMQADWALSLRNQCAAEGVPFFFKQWGEHNADGARVGKKAAGRLLAGREWNESPLVNAPALRAGACGMTKVDDVDSVATN